MVKDERSTFAWQGISVYYSSRRLLSTHPGHFKAS